MEMGFSQGQAAKAIAATGNTSTEAAMEWIFSHPESAEDAPAAATGGNAPTGQAPQPMAVDGAEKPPTVHNALCDTCKDQIVGTRHKCKSCKDYDLCDACYEKRLINHDPDHEFGHFTEDIPMPERKPLTPEEREAALKRLEEKRKEVLRLKQEEEKKAERERELKRRQMGKEILAAKEKFKEEQIQRDLALRKKEKQEEARALREIKEKLAREKAAKLAARQPAAAAAPAPAPAAAAPAAQPVAASSASTATEAVVQVRFPDGKTLQNSFKPDDSLRVVHSWVQASRTDGRPFALSTTFPRKDYSGSSLDSTTLRAADLVPRGALIVKNL